jgi:hypothetical protein
MPIRPAVIAVLLLAPLAATAQNPIPLPKALLFPNYDNVLIGKNQALEGGAYIARVNDASADFYNPAGLVAAERTSVNASSTGYTYSRLSSQASGESISTSRLDNAPGYFAVVLGSPVIDTRSLRFGFSVTRNVTWNPGGIDQAIPPTGSGFESTTFSTESSFQTQVYQLAAAWAPVPTVRLGVSGGLAQTTFTSRVTLSGTQSPTGEPGQFLSTLRANGTDYAVVIGLGIQWDILAALTVGVVFRSPGIQITNTSLVTQQSSLVQATSATSAYFRDDSGAFEYKLPLEASAGIAYRFASVEIELDLRYHDSVSQYDFYHSNVPYQFLTQANGTSSTTTQPPPLITNSARRVLNGELGGNVRLGRRATLHAGFYTAFSPVEDAATSPFRKADLYGFTGGADLQFGGFGMSLGAGYEFGTSSQTAGPVVLGNVLSASEISLQSLSLLYAFSYQF